MSTPEIHYLLAAMVDCTGSTSLPALSKVSFEFTTYVTKLGCHDAVDGVFACISLHRVLLPCAADELMIEGFYPHAGGNSNAKKGAAAAYELK